MYLRGSKPSTDLPHGGKSFTRRKVTEDRGENGKDNAAFNKNNRVTTYNQIDIDQMKIKSLSDEENLEPGDRISDHTYSVVHKKERNMVKPDVIPRVTKTRGVDRPGYLPMDGTSTKQSTDVVDQNYGFLESTRSTNSSRYVQVNRNGIKDSLYSATSSAADNSTYDVTFHRGSSQKRLVDEDYDHVMIESGSVTMNRSTCESIGEHYSSTNDYNVVPVINPGYDTVIIK